MVGVKYELDTAYGWMIEDEDVNVLSTGRLFIFYTIDRYRDGVHS
jgi:hypothetical protein